jgi:hypothetical protein
VAGGKQWDKALLWWWCHMMGEEMGKWMGDVPPELMLPLLGQP